jgi:ferritin-like metal-binding protein YciE
MAASLQEKVVEYLQDANAMEQASLQMLDALIASTKDPLLKEDMQVHRQETERQMDRIRDRLEELDEGSSMLKDAAARAATMPKALFDQMRGDQPGRNVRDAYTAEHLEIASYKLLERAAQRAGDSMTAAIARHNRDEEEDMASRIDDLWDRVVELTLAEEGVIAR